MQSGNSSALLLYLVMSSKDNGGSFYNISTAHNRSVGEKGPHTVRGSNFFPWNSLKGADMQGLCIRELQIHAWNWDDVYQLCHSPYKF